MKRINIAGNALSDFSIIEFVDCLKQIHNQTLESLNVSDNKISDEGMAALIDLCTKNKSLKEIVVEGLTDVTEPMLQRLKTALKKNQMGLGDSLVDDMYQTAKKVDQLKNRNLKFT